MIVQGIMGAHKDMSANTLRKAIRNGLLENMSSKGSIIKSSMTEKVGDVAAHKSIYSK